MYNKKILPYGFYVAQILFKLLFFFLIIIFFCRKILNHKVKIFFSGTINSTKKLYGKCNYSAKQNANKFLKC